MQECMLFDAEHMIQEKRGIVAPLGMQSSDEIFAFYSSALSFPDYFGWNWDAFDECIHDLYWIDGTTMHIVHPDIPFENDLDERAIMLSALHEIKLYSRTRGKLSIHFKASDKREIQESLFRYYRAREYCNENRYLEYYKNRRRWKDDPDVALQIIDKGMAITYAKMGFLDESEIDVVKDVP